MNTTNAKAILSQPYVWSTALFVGCFAITLTALHLFVPLPAPAIHATQVNTEATTVSAKKVKAATPNEPSSDAETNDSSTTATSTPTQTHQDKSAATTSQPTAKNTDKKSEQSSQPSTTETSDTSADETPSAGSNTEDESTTDDSGLLPGLLDLLLP